MLITYLQNAAGVGDNGLVGLYAAMQNYKPLKIMIDGFDDEDFEDTKYRKEVPH